MKYSIYGLLGSAILLSASANLQAAEDDNAIVVTATRTAQTVDDSLASVTVITSDDIQRSQAQYLQDLIQAYAGINVRNNGGPGKSTSVFLRGTESNHVLVMIDGVKIGSATSGGASFQNIPVSQIERIEIVRGPRSSLYGSEAIGGVIQIFTKKGSDKTATTAAVGYGQYNSSMLNAGLSGKGNNTRYSLNISSESTEGFNALKSDTLDDDGYSNVAVGMNASRKLGKNTDLLVHLLHARGNNEYDVSFDAGAAYDADFVQQSLGIGLNHTISSNWQTSVQLGQSLDESENFREGASTNSIFNTERQNLSWQNNITVSDNSLLTAGADYQNDIVDSTAPYTETSRDNIGLFAQYQINNQQSDFIFGLRLDDNQAYGSSTTWNLATGYQVSKKYRITASYGAGFNAPTLNELYYPGYGVPTLKPEESTSLELGLKAKYNWGYWDVHYYSTTIENLIDFTPANVNEANIQGLEFRLGGKFLGLQHTLDISYTDPRDESTDKVLVRRSRESMRYSIDETQGKFNYGMTFVGQGAQFDDAANSDRVNGYGLVNLRASYVYDKQWTIRAKVDNVFDKEYESIKSYNAAGVNAFISIHYQN